MVKIRLTRTGKKNSPSYRVVVTPAREKRESKFIEYIGHYSPITKKIEIKNDRAEYWLSVGAQPTDTVRALLIKQGVIKAEKTKKQFNKQPGRKATERKAKKEEQQQSQEAQA